MAKQTRPFVVEIKQSRKLKPETKNVSIWGSLDLKPDLPLDSDVRLAALRPTATVEVEPS